MGDTNIFILALTAGRHIDALIESGEFVVKENKIRTWDTYYIECGSEYYDRKPIQVYEIYIKRHTAQGSKIPIMLKEIKSLGDTYIGGPFGYKHIGIYKDIITGRIFRTLPNYNYINESNAVNGYFCGSAIWCDTNLVADTLRKMTNEDFEAYEKALCKLNEILYEEYCKSERIFAENKKRYEDEKQRAEDNAEYVKEFIKKRNNGK